MRPLRIPASLPRVSRRRRTGRPPQSKGTPLEPFPQSPASSFDLLFGVVLVWSHTRRTIYTPLGRRPANGLSKGQVWVLTSRARNNPHERIVAVSDLDRRRSDDRSCRVTQRLPVPRGSRGGSTCSSQNFSIEILDDLPGTARRDPRRLRRRVRRGFPSTLTCDRDLEIRVKAELAARSGVARAGGCGRMGVGSPDAPGLS